MRVNVRANARENGGKLVSKLQVQFSSIGVYSSKLSLRLFARLIGPGKLDVFFAIFDIDLLDYFRVESICALFAFPKEGEFAVRWEEY